MVSGDSSSSGSTSNVDITQKLQLLTMYFPKLRLMWSPSPYATAQLFEELKLNRDEPDATVAAALGSADASTKELLDNIIDRINPNIHDFLLRLPGITSRNIVMLMKRGIDLKHLLAMTEPELAELLASASNARLLYDICHATHKPVEERPSSERAGSYGSKFKRGGVGGGRRF